MILQLETTWMDLEGDKSEIEKQVLYDITYMWNLKNNTSPGSIHETGCSGLVQWDDPEGWDGEGDGPVVDSCQCMAKPIQYCKVISLQLKFF